MQDLTIDFLSHFVYTTDYMARVALTEVLNLRISADELEMIDRLADAEALPRSAMIRRLIRLEHAKRYTDQKSTPKGRAKPKRK